MQKGKKVEIDLTPYLEKEYEVDCNGERVKLKPKKAWIMAPRGKKGIIMGLFYCPDGSVKRKKLGDIELESE